MRRKMMLLAAAVLVLESSVPALAAEESQFISVFDQCDALDDSQEQALNEELAEIYNTYSFDAVILITEDVGDQDELSYATSFMEENQIGYGETGDGMCLLHQPESRNIDVVFQGEAKDAFTEKIQNIMLEDAVEVLKDDSKSAYEAYEVVLKDLKNSLKRVQKGKKIRPMDVKGSGIVGFAFLWLVISAVVMAIPTLIMLLLQKGKMKTEKQQDNANVYVHTSGLVLKKEEDVYLRTETSKERIQKDDDNKPESRSSSNEKTSGSGKSY